MYLLCTFIMISEVVDPYAKINLILTLTLTKSQPFEENIQSKLWRLAKMSSQQWCWTKIWQHNYRKRCTHAHTASFKVTSVATIHARLHPGVLESASLLSVLQLYFTFSLSSQLTFLILTRVHTHRYTPTHTHDLKPSISHMPWFTHTHTHTLSLLQSQVLQFTPAFLIFGTAMLIVYSPSPPVPSPTSTQRDTLFLLTPTPPGCSRGQVSMVTLLQNVRALFRPFVLSDEPVIHTCSLAETRLARVQHQWHSCHCICVCVGSK